MSVNFSYDFNYPADLQTLMSLIDIDDDEQGFTNGNNAPPWHYTDSQWLAKAQVLQAYLAQGHGWFMVNQEPVAFNQVTNDEVQWVLANYLLLKNNASYFYISGYQQYGYLNWRPEYTAPIGSASGQFYASQNVYMRDFTNGKAMVNPSSTQTYTVTLPANTFQDLYGNAVNSVTLGIHSGIVLLDSTSVMTPTVTPSATFTPTPSLTPTLTPTPIPLTVTITSPTNGSRIKHNTKITIQASVSDSLGITKVQFYVNFITGVYKNERPLYLFLVSTIQNWGKIHHPGKSIRYCRECLEQTRYR